MLGVFDWVVLNKYQKTCCSLGGDKLVTRCIFFLYFSLLGSIIEQMKVNSLTRVFCNPCPS